LIYGANIGYFSDIAKEKGRFFNLRENIYEKGTKKLADRRGGTGVLPYSICEKFIVR